MALSLTTPPVVEPISTAEAKTHMRIDSADDDAYIDTLIKAARGDTEIVTWRQLISATYTLTLDRFPVGDYIDLPKPPLQSVENITYVDTAGDAQTWAASNYDVEIAGTPGRVYLAYDASWPSIRSGHNAVTITYVAGYGDAGSDVPEEIRLAIKMKMAHWYENREAVVFGTPSELPIGIKRLDTMSKFRGVLNVYEDGLTSP